MEDCRSTALNYGAWEKNLLADYLDRESILLGKKHGSHIVESDLISHSVNIDNFKSATPGEMRVRTKKQIQHEIDNGHYRIVHERQIIISALGTIPKFFFEKVQIIYDCSQLAGSSLNDAASTNHFQYQSIQDAIDLTTQTLIFPLLTEL